MTLLLLSLLLLLRKHSLVYLAGVALLPLGGSPLGGLLALGGLASGGHPRPLLAALLAGSAAVLATPHLLGVYLGVELQSFALYLLVALAPHGGTGLRSGTLYFFAGSLASALLLAGLAGVLLSGGALDGPSLGTVGGVLLTLGLLTKLGALPFGAWAPQVYRDLHPLTGAVVMAVPKVPLLGALLLGAARADALPLLLAVGALSVGVGSLLGLAGRGAMATLALSSAAQVGWALLPAGLPGGAPDAVGYTVQYALATLALLAVLGGARSWSSSLPGVGGWAEAELRRPGLALAAAVLLLSYGGVPPLAGFYAKVGVLYALVASGALLLTLPLLWAAAVGMGYYLGLAARLLFPSTSGLGHPRLARLGADAEASTSAALATAGVLLPLPLAQAALLVCPF
jgi:NADH-quinone oxidoreductase subunit N